MYSHPTIANKYLVFRQLAFGNIVEHRDLPGVALVIVSGPVKTATGNEQYTVQIPDGQVVPVLRKNLIL